MAWDRGAIMGATSTKTIMVVRKADIDLQTLSIGSTVDSPLARSEIKYSGIETRHVSNIRLTLRNASLKSGV